MHVFITDGGKRIYSNFLFQDEIFNLIFLKTKDFKCKLKFVAYI